MSTTTQSHTMTQEEHLSLCLLVLSQNYNNANVNTSLKDPKPHFECSICGKSFTSYQALGGHKSSHRKPTDTNQIKQIIATNPTDFDKKDGSHRCNVCYRSFSTGQALGGHKRCHYWDGSVSVSGSATSTLTSVRDFDLNLPPRSGWGEEEEVVSPYELPIKKRRLI